jgi:transcriptional regulator with XRE-family HTH domain
MGRKYWPGIYVAMPMTGISAEREKRDQDISLTIQRVAEAAGYNVYLPWWTSYHPPPGKRLHPGMYAAERQHVLKAELVVVIASAGSTGLGRVLEIAETELIPTVYVCPDGAPSSLMGRGYNPPLDQIWISEPEDLVSRLESVLTRYREQLDFRRSLWPPRRVPPVIARRIREERDRRGWSRRDLADRMRVRRGYIDAIEDGQLVPSLYALRVIAHFLEIELWRLLQPTFSAGTKQGDEEVILRFFRNNDPGMQRFERFTAAIENRRRAGDPPPTEEEMWTIYRVLFATRD